MPVHDKWYLFFPECKSIVLNDMEGHQRLIKPFFGGSFQRMTLVKITSLSLSPILSVFKSIDCISFKNSFVSSLLWYFYTVTFYNDWVPIEILFKVLPERRHDFFAETLSFIPRPETSFISDG